jgi:hypothetical protein
MSQIDDGRIGMTRPVAKNSRWRERGYFAPTTSTHLIIKIFMSPSSAVPWAYSLQRFLSHERVPSLHFYGRGDDAHGVERGHLEVLPCWCGSLAKGEAKVS